MTRAGRQRCRSRRRRPGGRRWTTAAAVVGRPVIAMPDGLRCPTALAFGRTATASSSQGSRRHAPSDWAADLMEKNAAGSLWRIDLRQAAMPPAWPAASPFPMGSHSRRRCGDRRRELAPSAHPRSRPQSAPPEPVLAMLPGYPARLAPAADGGAWLALFAPRNRLIEFVLPRKQLSRRHDARGAARLLDRARAVVGRAASSSRCNAAASSTMGIHKPWSPSRSYGLVVRLDRDDAAGCQLHSRANGTAPRRDQRRRIDGRRAGRLQGRRRHPRHRSAGG